MRIAHMWLRIVYKDDSNFDKSSSCNLMIRVNTDRMVNRFESDSSNSEFANHWRITIYTLFVIRKFVVIRDDLRIVYSWLFNFSRIISTTLLTVSEIYQNYFDTYFFIFFPPCFSNSNHFSKLSPKFQKFLK